MLRSLAVILSSSLSDAFPLFFVLAVSVRGLCVISVSGLGISAKVGGD